MRNIVLASNWKMNKTFSEAKAYSETLVKNLSEIEGLDVIVAVPHIYIQTLLEQAKGAPFSIAAQDAHYEKKGAFTGEVSAYALADMGVEYVIVGHSERRSLFGDDDATVNKKVKAVLENGMRPLLCVGESLEHRENGKTEAFVANQLEKALDGVTAEQAAKIIIGYEPIWAIGTGKTASAEEANETIAFIREKLADLYSQAIADQIIIQYGGSVKLDNISEFVAQPEIDGALVGGASLDADDFIEMTKLVTKHD